ncbi:MAG: alkaline phosphatase D family protein [Bryobacteraceae bacterium]|nr:alkaline phosphatase D family protein [Bryobacteraceae bacterium]
MTRRYFLPTLASAGLGVTFSERLFAQAGPFQHNVASGDPLADRVILWTRVTLPAPGDLVAVNWEVATDAGFSRVVRRGTTSTSAAFDFTVKVDVDRLDAGTTYYYRFLLPGGVSSPIGRTKTLPLGSVSRLRFAVTSCSNYPAGYFNAYRLIANRADLDVVLHLGDYIYEYAEGTFGSGAPTGRAPIPNKETVTLTDYRQRYAQYRTDPDLQEVHRQHPFIVVWDDHESANNAWKGGAQNHQPETEGDWETRKAVSAQAWREWMPVRETPYGAIYRSFRFGDLMDLAMLDTRIAGRDEQVSPFGAEVDSRSRSLLGAEQEDWFHRQLTTSKLRGARWRVVGQQVMMAQLAGPRETPFNPDQWDGYAATRGRLLDHLRTRSIDNMVVLTGDIHSSWASEISENPFSSSGSERQAVEFVATSVTSTTGLEDSPNADAVEQLVYDLQPHVKYVNLTKRGYLLVDIDRDRAQGEWYHLATVATRSLEQSFAKGYLTASGSSALTVAAAPAPTKSAAPLAP